MTEKLSKNRQKHNYTYMLTSLSVIDWQPDNYLYRSQQKQLT